MFLNGVLAIEFFVDADNHPQVILEHKDVNQLNQALAQDLLYLIPELPSSAMALIGALYQSCEILQPGFPIHKQLRHYINASLKAANFANNQLIIGSHQGQLPPGFYAPENKQSSAMFYMPFVIKTEESHTVDFFENQLMHKGMGSVELLQQLQTSFSAKIRHANFMSTLDLAAMMHNHMQMAGFSPLWNLIEQALFNEAPECKEQTEIHNIFYLSKKMVMTPFFSERFWTQNLKYERSQYPHYLFTQRQYVSTLSEHGLDVRQFLPTQWPLDETHVCFASLNQSVLNESFFKEEIQPLQAQIQTPQEKNHPQLGTMYIEVQDDCGGLVHYYPLKPSGVEYILQVLEKS